MSSNEVPSLGGSTSALRPDPSSGVMRKLPNELVYHIIRLAASSDYKTAHSCALVSRTVCRWTAPDRWKTIVITSARQLDSLEDVLDEVEREPHDKGSALLSLPSPQPCDFVQNLFIETDDMWYETDLDTTERYKRMQEAARAEGRTSPFRLSPFIEQCRYVDYLALGPSEVSDLEPVPRVSPRKWLLASENEDCLKSHLEYIGDTAGDLFPLCYGDGNGRWYPAWDGFKRRLKAIHVIAINAQSAVTGIPMPVDDLAGLHSGSLASRSLLRELTNEVAHHNEVGPPEPTDIYQDATMEPEQPVWPEESDYGPRGTFEHSPQHSMTVGEHDAFGDPYTSLSPAFWTDRQQGITHLRYDTRKFSLRPCEITASRLKPYFVELTTATDDPIQAHLGDPSSGVHDRTAGFTHNGPRHAAPPRGAGNFANSNRAVDLHGSQTTHKQAVLDAFGRNKFQKLHLCWDPYPVNIAGSSAASQMATLNDRAGVAQASAPNDTDWPVERHDIWTNTASQNNEARAPPPHITNSHRNIARSSRLPGAKSSDASGSKRTSLQPWVIPAATESQQSKNFRADMVEAFRGLIGWTRQDQELLSDNPGFPSDRDRLLQALADTDHNYVNAMEGLVSTLASHRRKAMGLTGPPVSSDEKLALRLVPPAERLRLGGLYVPYTKEQRVKWFLDNLDTDVA